MERGMTEVHLEEAQLKRKAIESTTQVIALVDSSKFGKKDLTLFARLEQITHLFVDAGLASKVGRSAESGRSEIYNLPGRCRFQK
jgi:DeoR/GlpR family transcriptional regulator of sugar metabolism